VEYVLCIILFTCGLFDAVFSVLTSCKVGWQNLKYLL
jgi:hypothetical protein